MPTEHIPVAGPRQMKVPGLLPQIKEKDTHLTDLSKYDVPELIELRDRQKHLLANK